MSEQQSSYRQIVKATSIFGGVQIFNIFISIIRSKFVAVLLGPTGMGVAGLLTATIGLMGGLTNFGLGTSAIKNVSSAYSSGDLTGISRVFIILRRWVWVTGLLGMILTIVTAPFLSQLTFGNKDYTFPFIWISVSLLFAQLSSGQLVLLQGMRKLKLLAKANLSGSVVGLLTTVPLYYWLGIKGIVPAIIVTSLITWAISWFFAGNIKVEKVYVSNIQTIIDGKEMLTMGFMISLSGLITMGASFLARIFISNYGGVDQVGLYNAGFAIINSYVGLVFAAMATDYFPRLAAVANSNTECNMVINQQAQIAVLILAPIIIIFIVFIKWIVVLLYSAKFAPINDMIMWAALGMFFKTASWAVGYVFLAKSKSRLFLMNEVIANLYTLIFNLIGYYYYGLTGLGVSFLVGYLAYLIQVFMIARKKFEFRFHREMYILFFVQFTLACLSSLPALFRGGNMTYLIGVVLLSISLCYSYRELDKRLGVKSLVKTKIFNK